MNVKQSSPNHSGRDESVSRLGGERLYLETWASIIARTTLSRAELNRMIVAGTFPRPFRIGTGRRVAFDAAAVDRWIAEQIGEGGGA